VSANRISNTRAPWIMLAPFLVLFLIFTAYPLAQSLVLSTRQTFGPGTSRFIGLDNFRFMLTDPLFYTALRNTTIYTLGSVFIQLPLALGLALLLNHPRVRARALLRLVFFAPSLVGVVFVAMLFGVILDKRTGLVNVALHGLTQRADNAAGWLAGTLEKLGMPGAWLRDAGSSIIWPLDVAWMHEHTLWALVLVSLWMWVGFNMVYFLAALQNVPGELREAAIVDGAGPFRRFGAVIFPAIRPVAGFVVLLSIIGSFQLFELPWILLNSSGGPGNRGLTIISYLYQTGFESGDLGYASAIGWVLAVILMFCAALQRLLARGEVEA